MNYLLDKQIEIRPINQEMNYILEYINQIKLLKFSRVLEIGIGTGNKSIELSKKFKSYYGIEPLENIYKKFLEICNITNCKIKSFNMDFDNFIKLSINPFDIIIIINTIHLIELDLDEFIEKSKQILKSNGFIIIQNPKAKPDGWGNQKFNSNSNSFDESKWIKFREELKKYYKNLDSSKYLIKKISNDNFHIFLLKF